MKTFTAGEFVLAIMDPHPMWVDIANDSGRIRLRHTELIDLKHIIERAIAEAERKCPGETA